MGFYEEKIEKLFKKSVQLWKVELSQNPACVVVEAQGAALLFLRSAQLATYHICTKLSVVKESELP